MKYSPTRVLMEQFRILLTHEQNCDDYIHKLINHGTNQQKDK